MDVGLTIASTFFVTVALCVIFWRMRTAILLWKNKIETLVNDSDANLLAYVKGSDARLDRYTLSYRTNLAEVVERVHKIEEQLKEAHVVRVDAKTGAFIHTDESEAAAEKEMGLPEPILIGAAKGNGTRHEFATLGGVDAFDKLTMEEVSNNAGKEAERSRQDQ